MAELPQIVRQRLRATPSSGIHPDADVLAAFGERSLPEAERALVLDHLARCGDCREVLGLALPESEAADFTTKVNVQRGWFGWPRVRWALVAAGIVAAASVGVEQFREHQRTNVTVAQVMSRGPDTYAPAPTPAAPSKPVATPAPPPGAREEGSLKSPGIDVSSKPTAAEAIAVPQAGRADSTMSALVASGRAPGTGLRRKSKMAMAEAPPESLFSHGTSRPVTPAMGNQAPSPAPAGEAQPSVAETVEVQAGSSLIAPQSGAPSQDQSLQSQNAVEPRVFSENTDVVARAKPPVLPSAAPPAAPASTPRWTISSTGRLQRSLDGNTWQEVEVAAKTEPVASFMIVENVAKNQADQSAKGAGRKKEEKNARGQTAIEPVFRAVAAEGLEVWAGGSGGMLYHSADGGELWTRVQPAADGVALKGDITSIQFSDPHHGTVGTSSSELWTTSDGGQSWRKQ